MQPIAAITAALVGLHATDPAAPYLSLWARSPNFVTADLDGELYRKRSMVKHLAMRRTLWLMNADDLVIVQPAASDRVADNERRRLIADVQKAGVASDGAHWLDHACAAVLRHLDNHGPANTPSCGLHFPSCPEPMTQRPENHGVVRFRLPRGC